MTETSLTGLATVAVLGAARTVPAITLLPAFGGRHLRWEVRAAVGVLVTLLALPALPVAPLLALLGAAGPLAVAALLAREIAIGLTVGFVAGLLFKAVEAAGALGDTLRGANMGEALAPGGDSRDSPLGMLYGLLATVIFLELGGLGRLIAALVDSYQAVPLAAAPPLASGFGPAAQVVVAASAKLIATAVALAAPILVAALLTDLALGAVARVAPQLPVYFIGLPIKALFGVLVILLGLGALRAAIGNDMAGWWELIQRALTGYRR